MLVTAAPRDMAQSAGAASGIQPPAPARAPTWAMTTSATVQPTAASIERVSVAIQAIGALMPAESNARTQSRASAAPLQDEILGVGRL